MHRAVRDLALAPESFVLGGMGSRDAIAMAAEHGFGLAVGTYRDATPVYAIVPNGILADTVRLLSRRSDSSSAPA
jgi:hypothetical protein